MTLEERIKICSTCKNKTFSSSEGLLCGKTGRKPEFVNTCYDYDADSKEIERQKAKLEEEAKSDEISGFMAFYVYWSIPIGIVITLISLFTSQIITPEVGSNICLTLYAVVFYAMYFYFSIYTIYAFVKKKSDAVFIAKYQLIILFINNLLTLITGNVGGGFLAEPSRLIPSLAWSVIFFLYLTFSEDVEYRIPKENRKLTKHNKTLFILSIILPVLLYVGAVFEFAKSTNGFTVFSTDETKIEQICKNTDAELPMLVGDGLYWTDVTVEEQTVEFKYEYIDEAYQDFQSFNSDAIYALLSNYQTELVKFQYASLIYDNTDPLLAVITQNGTYNLRFSYCSPDGEPLYYVNISSSEISQMAKDGIYATNSDSFASLVDSYNAILPIEYFEECMLRKCFISEDESTLHYDLRLVNMTMGDLSGLNQKYLKEYILELMPYFTDAPGVIARINNMDISYDFSADCSDWWNSKVLVKATEYNEILSE
jgi:hypothetical protein